MKNKCAKFYHSTWRMLIRPLSNANVVSVNSNLPNCTQGAFPFLRVGRLLQPAGQGEVRILSVLKGWHYNVSTHGNEECVSTVIRFHISMQCFIRPQARPSSDLFLSDRNCPISWHADMSVSRTPQCTYLLSSHNRRKLAQDQGHKEGGQTFQTQHIDLLFARFGFHLVNVWMLRVEGKPDGLHIRDRRQQ